MDFLTDLTHLSDSQTVKNDGMRMEWLGEQRSSERWHMCAVNFFNGLCVIINFFNDTRIKAYDAYHLQDPATVQR